MEARETSVQAPDRHKHSDDHPAELTETEVRQADHRQMNLRVVVIGILLAALAGLGIAAAFYLPADRQPAVSGAPPKP